MRPVALAGLVLVILGGFVLLRGLSYTTQKSVFTVGDFNASVEEHRMVPPWIGGVVAAAGLVLLVTGSRKRS